MSNASISARVAKSFSARSCVEGFPLFTKDEVALTRASPRAIEATVKTQRVQVDIENGALAASCSCGTTACKHLWATLLAVDRAGSLEAVRGGIAPLALVAAIAKKPTIAKAKKRGTTRSKKRNAKKA